MAEQPPKKPVTAQEAAEVVKLIKDCGNVSEGVLAHAIHVAGDAELLSRLRAIVSSNEMKSDSELAKALKKTNESNKKRKREDKHGFTEWYTSMNLHVERVMHNLTGDADADCKAIALQTVVPAELLESDKMTDEQFKQSLSRLNQIVDNSQQLSFSNALMVGQFWARRLAGIKLPREQFASWLREMGETRSVQHIETQMNIFWFVSQYPLFRLANTSMSQFKDNFAKLKKQLSSSPREALFWSGGLLNEYQHGCLKTVVINWQQGSTAVNVAPLSTDEESALKENKQAITTYLQGATADEKQKENDAAAGAEMDAFDAAAAGLLQAGGGAAAAGAQGAALKPAAVKAVAQPGNDAARVAHLQQLAAAAHQAQQQQQQQQHDEHPSPSQQLIQFDGLGLSGSTE